MELSKIHFANDESLNYAIKDCIQDVADTYKSNLSKIDISVAQWLQFIHIYTKPNRLEFVFQSSSNYIAIVVPMNCRSIMNRWGVDLDFIYEAITSNYDELYSYFRDEKYQFLKAVVNA